MRCPYRHFGGFLGGVNVARCFAHAADPPLMLHPLPLCFLRVLAAAAPSNIGTAPERAGKVGPVLGYPMKSTSIGQPEQFYRDIFDEAPSALFSIGTDGRILAANRRALQLLGYQPNEIIARGVLDLYAAGSTGKISASDVFRKFRAGLEIHGRELEMQRADGTRVFVRLLVHPIRDTEGRVLASCSMVQPISAPPWVGHELPRHGKDTAGAVLCLPDGSRTNEKDLERVLVKSAGCTYFLSVSEIDWFGAAGNYIEVHVGSRTYLLRRTMNNLQGSLDPSRFFRIHRATIVNAERIRELRARPSLDYDIILRDGVQLPLSRSYRKKLWRFLDNAI